MRNSLICLLTLSTLLVSPLLYASPWQCLHDWAINHKDYLKENGVTLGSNNIGLIESFYFNSTGQPFQINNGKQIQSQHTQLGESILHESGIQCYCINMEIDSFEIKGLCGHY